MEQVHVLEHHGDVGKQAVAGQLTDIVAAHRDAAAVRVIEPGQQAADRRFAGAGRAHNGGGSMLRDGEAHVVQHLTAVVAEVHMVKGDVEVLQRDIFAVAVDEVVLPQLVQLVHGVVDDAQHMGAVADGLEAGKDAEGEEHERQHHRQLHLTVQSGQAGGKRQPHAAAFKGQQVQRVGGQIAPFDLQVDVLAVGDGLADGVQRSGVFAERFDHRKAPGIFQNGTGHIPVGLCFHGGIPGAVAGDEQQKHQRHCRCRQRNDRRAGTEHQQAEEHHRKVQVAAHEAVDHADAHAFQRAKTGGERVEDVAGAHLLEVAQRHPLEGVAHGKAVPGHQLIADGFLKTGAEVIEQETEKDQHQHQHKAFPHPAGIKRRAVHGTLQQQADGVGRQHDGQRREQVGEKKDTTKPA